MSGDVGVVPSPGPSTAGAARPDPLGYPRPTTARYVILVLALLAGGLYIGGWVHNLMVGEEWLREDARCRAAAAQPASRPPTAFETQAETARCMAWAEQRRAAFAAAGGAATLLGGLATLLVVPGVITRRRGLRELPDALAATRARVRELAGETGLPRPPALMLGRSTQRDAFSYGVPGRYRVALPPKAALRPHDAGVFDPVLRHELAHVAHHDVALAWLARSLWYAFLPLLLVPVVLSAVREDLSVTLEYVARAGVVLVTVRLVADALLRAREHDADLAAGRDPRARAHLLTLLARIDRGSGSPRASFWRALRAQHPSAARRRQVLDDPTEALHPSATDALTAAFLAATAAPLVESTGSALLAASGRVGLATAAAALLSGSLLGVAVGLGLWRAAVFARFAGRPVQTLPLALGVGGGFALGRALSLGQVASGLGVDKPAVLVVPLVAGVGATAAVAGLALLWGDVAPHLSTARPHWVAALVTSGLVFAAALAAAEAVVTIVDVSGPRMAVRALATGDPSWLLLTTGVVVAPAAAWPLVRRGGDRGAPVWAFPGGGTRPWPAAHRPGPVAALVLGAAAGTAAVVVLVAFRVISGVADAAGEREARVIAYVTIAAAAGAAALAAAILVWGPRGAGAGLVALPVAVLVAIGGLLALTTAPGGRVSAGVLGSVLGSAWAFALVLALLAGGVALLVHALARSVAGRDRDVRAARATAGPHEVGAVLVAVLLTVAAATLALVDRASLAAATLARPPVASAPSAAQAYVQDVVVPLRERLGVVDRAARAVDAEASLTPQARAALIRSEVLPLVRAVQRTAGDYEPTTPEVAEAHALAVRYLATLTQGLDALAAALQRQEPAELERAHGLLEAARAERAAWLAAVVTLQGG